MKTHCLKIQPKYFDAIVGCGKRFELRRDDRDFAFGDELILREWDNDEFTGNMVIATITYVLRDVPQYGLADDCCIIGFTDPVYVMAKPASIQRTQDRDAYLAAAGFEV